MKPAVNQKPPSSSLDASEAQPHVSVRAAVSAWMDEPNGVPADWMNGADAPSARDAWDDFHAVRDALHASPVGAAPIGADRLLRVRQSVMAQLASVPQDGLDSAPAAAAVVVPVGLEINPPVRRQLAEAANAPIWRWRVAAALASVVAVGSLMWNLGLGAGGGGDSAAQQARANLGTSAVALAEGGTAPMPGPVASADAASGTVTVATGAGVMIRDPRLDELLAAHRQHGGASALQLPTGFLRAATFDGASR